MEGFKSNPKMKSDIACYKEGGSVYKSRTHKEDPKEAAEDKAMVKKGIRQHEASKHKGQEKTEIKLKDGGRSKKAAGTVRKYKAGGSCEAKKDGGAIAMKKSKDDKKSIAQTKKTKAGKADTPSAATGKKKESPKTTNKPAAKTMTASMVGELPETPVAPSAAMSMPEDQPIEMMADGGTPGMYGGGMMTPQVPVGQSGISDEKRQMIMRQMMQMNPEAAMDAYNAAQAGMGGGIGPAFDAISRGAGIGAISDAERAQAAGMGGGIGSVFDVDREKARRAAMVMSSPLMRGRGR